MISLDAAKHVTKNYRFCLISYDFMTCFNEVDHIPSMLFSR